MAKNIVIRDVTYQAVPSVEIPISGSDEVAQFIDTSDATLNSGSQMLDGVTAYADGVKITGTIPSKSSSDLTASGATVTVPAGNYASQASKSVASGKVTPPSSITGTGAQRVVNANSITLNKTVSATPTVTTEGYVTSGTAGNVSVSLTASLTTQGTTTYTPTTTDQTISGDTFLTGTQTISGDPNLVGSNIVAGKSIFGVAGSAQIPVISQDSTTKVLSIS